MRLVVSLLLPVIFFACSSGPVPNNIFKPASMQKVVYDLMQVDEYMNVAKRDSAEDVRAKRSILYEQVFRIHNTTRKEFYSSYKYYQQHPDLHKALFDSLLSQMNRNNNTRLLPRKL